MDYGCGSGLFTNCLRQISSAAVHALDFHSDPPADLDQIDYRSFSRSHDLIGCADLIIASHVLEHDNDPVDLLQRMATLLRSGGHLVIEVPNIDCWGARVFGSWWDAWYLPYHRIHFSRTSLRASVEGAGLQVVSECGATVPTMGRTLANVVGQRHNLFFLLAGVALQPLQITLERLTKRPSALRIVAQKP